MSNGNCGQQESSCNPLTGVDKMGGRKQPNVQRPSNGSILRGDWRERRGTPTKQLSSTFGYAAAGWLLKKQCELSRSTGGLQMNCLYRGTVNSKN